MIARRVRFVRMFAVALALALTLLVGCMCFASEHTASCGDPVCPICRLLERGMIPAACAVLAAAAFQLAAARPLHVISPARGVSLVCYRTRMDD